MRRTLLGMVLQFRWCQTYDYLLTIFNVLAMVTMSNRVTLASWEKQLTPWLDGLKMGGGFC